MANSEFQPLFATPGEDDESWVLPVDSKLGTMELPIVLSQLVQEIKDQAEIKSNQRKAIVRATQKAIVRGGKLGADKLSAQDVEQFKWNLFILKVDEGIAGRHAAIRANWDLANEIANEPLFRA